MTLKMIEARAREILASPPSLPSVNRFAFDVIEAVQSAQAEIARLRGVVAADMLETGSCGSGATNA